MMKDYMEGLSVKVFRTYNASVTLDRLLWDASASTELVEKKADYDRANKEVRPPLSHTAFLAYAADRVISTLLCWWPTLR